jgi:hypothetical protein
MRDKLLGSIRSGGSADGLFVLNAVVFTDVQGLPPRRPQAAARTRFRQKHGDWGDGRRKDARPQAVLHVRRSDCQQISAHPSERNAS